MRLKLIKKYWILVLCLCLMTLLGCQYSGQMSSTTERGLDESVQQESETTTQPESEKTTQQENEKSDDSDKADSADNSGSEDTSEKATDFPVYSGDVFVELNGNQPDFTDDEKKSTEAFENYSDLDELGRCGVAFANICKDIMPTEERGEIGDVRPSGWHTVKYPEVIEDRYLYNRSHLIAYSLAGENANVKNLITGTRYLNQETMQIFELKVLDYVRNSDNHVLYRVTPVFEGDNLVATGVKMEAWSVEDEGEGICFNVFCYNVQPNIEINYVTGDSKVKDDVVDITSENASNSDAPLAGEKKTQDFIVNTNTLKFHLPSCKSVSDMAEHNKMEYTGTIEELKQKGYTPCGRCLAEYR